MYLRTRLPVAAIVGTLLLIPAAAIAATINGTAANDFLPGTDAADTMRGYGGNDVIVGYGGLDTIDGGSGGDELVTSTLVYSASSPWIHATFNSSKETVTCGSGFDTVYFDLNDRLTDMTACETEYRTGDGNPNLLRASGTGTGDALFGLAGDDTLTLDGAPGAIADGGTGADTILSINQGAVVDVSLHGGSGRDTISTNARDARIYEGTGRSVSDGSADRITCSVSGYDEVWYGPEDTLTNKSYCNIRHLLTAP